MKKTLLCMLLCVLLVLAAMTGCAAGNDSAAEDAVAGAPAGGDAADAMTSGSSTQSNSAPGAMGSGSSAGGSDADGYYDYGDAAGEAETGVPQTQTESGLPANTKLIYTAELSLETTQFDTAVAGLEQLVAAAGGYFETSELNNYANYRSGHYVVRVPAEKFHSFCADVGELCQVNSLYRSAEDISEQYYDTEARLVTQQTKLERLQNLLAGAETMEDIITIETAISDTELEIENLTGTLRRYDSLVGYSTIHIWLDEVYELTEVEEPVIGFGARLAAAFRSGANSFVNGLKSLLLSFAYNWTGVLIFLAIVAAATIIVLRVVRKKRREEDEYREYVAARRAKWEEKEEPKQEGGKKEEKKEE